MMYKTHLATSIALSSALVSTVSYPFTISFLAGVSLGSLLPDIDEPKSFIGRRSFGLAVIIKRKFGHRGITHSLSMWVGLLFFLLLLVPNPFTLGIALGYFFHILGDYFSVSGVPLFSPIDNVRRKSPLTYKTSGKAETVIYYVAILISLFFILDDKMLTPFIESVWELVTGVLSFFFQTLG
ncbi:metal-dependent hydrolase [Peribacillus frigoritolerans]|uniref:metal-dependent hydrolase n=1 Tax=Peribacillus frigoritolerans TaxID=450367 RepID=UPI00207A0CA2|nr:metal-dependent hydrolase [Peribacillus frigoritolerans]USK75913.1 metal-dependent hydrolase [Peribacillus frigoritolerans]